MLSRLSKARLVLAILAVCMMVNVGLVFADEVTVKGVVSAKGDSFVLTADDGEYVLEGENIADYVDQTVEVTGSVSEKDGVKVLEVSSINKVE
ncbi:DUF5818 domain-containing protein [Thermodesulforhabdus norvegica]|uniref:DUF5666 domain-containing protein n=1 Tax=Thermodesulforhabdus norvegica TaxID=39841 RepID=A0A1I4UDE7_9BACT|nr:DUF5818 domain-containing protein [Thermodesulforhabdus norvegica]SFM86861.1 hypothetical protein SAMN05660836_01791 [Thermodesulforhabdus norvegica]